MVRTVRDMAYVMKLGKLTPRVMNEIVIQYNNAPHRGLSKWCGFPVSPQMVQDDTELEDLIARRIAMDNDRIMNSAGFQLPVGTSVAVFNERNQKTKYRSATQPGKHSIAGTHGSLYVVRDDAGRVQLIPRYKLSIA